MTAVTAGSSGDSAAPNLDNDKLGVERNSRSIRRASGSPSKFGSNLSLSVCGGNGGGNGSVDAACDTTGLTVGAGGESCEGGEGGTTAISTAGAIAARGVRAP